jgi:Prolyl oligopeptidase family
LDSMFVTISLPDSIPVEGLPVMIVLGGLEIGRESLKYIPAQGPNIIMAYQYPYHPRYWYDKSKITQIPVIQEAVMKVPAQVVALADWAKRQVWSDKNRLSVLGYSFGAFFVPAIYHLADHHQLVLGPAVMAYGGVDMYAVMINNLKFMSGLPRMLVAWTATTAIYPMEPALHLPYLKGEFLVINGRMDRQIPEACWQRFQQLTPSPKTIMVLEAGHMHPSKPELTLRVVELSRQWLLEHNAINP